MLGLFLGVCPLWGYQIMLIIFFCYLTRLNVAIALAAGHISIPPMIPLILYTSYQLGGMMIGQSTTPLSLDTIDFFAIRDNLLQYVVGSFILGILLAIVFGAITYILLLLFRKERITKSTAL